MAWAAKEIAVIILNIGQGTAPGDNPEDPSFMSKAKECMMKLLESKIFTKPKDEVALFLMGTEESNNALHINSGGYNHISSATGFVVPTWDLLKVLRNDIQVTQNKSDWLEALAVAMDFIAAESSTKKISSIKIVLITPFLEDVAEDKVDGIITQLKAMNVDLIVISDALDYQCVENDADGQSGLRVTFTQSQGKSQKQLKSEQLIERIINETNGVLSNFSDAVLQLSYFPRTKTKSMPWYCPLTIGDDLRLNMAAYTFIARDTMKSFKTESTDPKAQNVKCVFQFMRNGRAVPAPEQNSTIEGYVYGNRKVAYDKSLNLDFDAGGKSFMCVGFSPRKYVLDEYFTGKNTYLVVPQSTCDISIRMANALGRALLDMDMILIARRVRQQREKPKIMALFPVVHSEFQSIYFHMIELFYRENQIDFEFANLSSKKHDTSDEHKEAIRELIKTRNLMTAGEDGTELFATNRTLNPAMQFIYRVIGARAMDPKAPLPKFSDDLAAKFEVPKDVMERSSEAVQKIKELFPIEIKQEGNKQKWMKKKIFYSDNKNGAADADASDPIIPDRPTTIAEIGSITPMEDFDLLFRQGEKFANLCFQLQAVLSDLLFKSISWDSEAEKISKALLFYREQSKNVGAHYYNDWIESLKTSLLHRNKTQFFQEVIVKEMLGIITTEESETSCRTADEASEFYSTTSPMKKTQAEASDSPTDDNLFDEM